MIHEYDEWLAYNYNYLCNICDSFSFFELWGGKINIAKAEIQGIVKRLRSDFGEEKLKEETKRRKKKESEWNKK